jgi:integrase
MGKLTNAALPRLLKKSGRHSDGQGLFFRSLGLDRAYWVYRYRSAATGGKDREFSIGPYPEVTLVEARAKHAELRKRVVVDHADPLAERRAQRASVLAPTASTPTFGQLSDDHMATHASSWSAKHHQQWRLTLSEYCGSIREKPVSEIDTAAVLKVLKPLWTRAPETASRLRARIETVISAAQALGHIDENRANPARWKGHLERLLPNPRKTGKPRRNHAAMPYAELPAFMARLKAAQGVAVKALMFTILTAARAGEVIGMPCDGELDLDPPNNVLAKLWPGPTWTVPAKRMKMRKEHRVPLSDAAVAILRDQLAKRGPQQTYLFESPIAQGSRVHRDGAHQPLSDMSMAMMMRRLGVGQYTVHGFRSSFRSWAADHGVAFEVAEQCLAHTVGNAVVQAYQRSSMLERRRPVMAEWASFVMGEASAKVVSFKRA